MEESDRRIVSNNVLVKNAYQECLFVDGSVEQVMRTVRDLVHRGYRLISYPLPASMRMMYSPVRSIFLEKKTGLDEDSVFVIERSIQTYSIAVSRHSIDYAHEADYSRVDYELLQAAFREYRCCCVDRSL